MTHCNLAEDRGWTKVLEILEREWEAWYTDESLWPTDPSCEMFCRWFHYRYCSVVCDLSAEPWARQRE